MTRFSHRSVSEGGFTLLELMLAIGVAAILFLGISKVTQSWVNDEVANGGGQNLQRVAMVVQAYVEANWAGDANGVQLTETSDVLDTIANVPNTPWAALLPALQQEGLLLGNKLHSPLGSELQVSYVNDTANKLRRISIFSKTALPNSQIRKAARLTGSSGGTITSFPSSTVAQGIFGQWSVNVTDLRPTSATGTFPCVATATRGCLISMTALNLDQLCGPFLYRNDVSASADCSDGNTMRATLDMDKNDISRAGKINTDNLNVEDTAVLGKTTVLGAAELKGPTTMSQTLDVVGAMSVQGNATFADNLDAQVGTVNATQLNASTIEAPSIDTNQLNTKNMTVSNGDLIVENNMSVNGDLDVSGAGAETYAGTINANAINTGNGEIITGQMTVANSMEISGDVDITSSLIQADKLVVDKCVRIKNTNPAPGNYTDYGVGPC